MSKSTVLVAFGAFIAGLAVATVAPRFFRRLAAPVGVASTLPGKQEQSFLSRPEIAGTLPGGAKARLTADTWDQLVALAKPDLTWRPPGYRDGRDLLWLEKDAQNRPVFRLDRTYTWQIPFREPCWVLLEPGTEDLFQFDLEFTEDRIAVTPEIPRHDAYESYAVALASGTAGIVYEIGWSDGDHGSAHREDLRILYVWQHADGRLQFLGEGANLSQGHSGGAACSDGLKSAVEWRKEPLSPRIVYSIETLTCEVGEEQMGLAPLINQTDYTLEAADDGTAGVPRVVGKARYFEVMPDITLDEIARSIAMRGADSRDAERGPEWNFGDETHPLLREQLEKNAELQAQTKALLLRANPGLATQPVRPGQKLFLPSAAPQ